MHDAWLRLMSYWSVYRFILRRIWLFPLGVVAIAVSFLIFFNAPWALNLARVASAIVIIASSVRLATEFRRIRAQLKGVYREDRAIIQIDPEFVCLAAPYSGTQIDSDNFTVRDFKAGTAIASESLNKLLSERPIPFEILPQEYKWPPLALRIAPIALRESLLGGHIVLDGRKVRLASDLTAASVRGGIAASVQHVGYYATLCTNDQSFLVFTERSSGTVVYDGNSFFLDPGHVLCSLAHSLCGNHIGANSVVITADALLLTPTQTRRNLQAPRQLMPSGAGSADWEDLTRDCRNLQEFVADAAIREFCEECGLRIRVRSSRPVWARTVVIGYVRHLDRGGKPDFYCATQFGGTMSDLERLGRERVFIQRVQRTPVGTLDGSAIVKAINRFRDENHTRCSFPLLANLSFLERFLAEHPNWFLAQADGSSRDCLEFSKCVG